MTFKEHFMNCYPNEGVGYVKDGVFFPLQNIAANPTLAFEVDPSFLLNEPDVLLHSHCVGQHEQTTDPRSPSYEDLLGQQQTGIEWGICVTDGSTCEDPLYWGNPKNRPALEGRDFIFNIQDCLCLMQDWYFSEYGIELPTQPRTPGWNEHGQNYFEDLYQQWGFERVPLQDLKRGDVLFYKVRSPVVNHIGVYLGDGQVISHWYGRLSCVEPFGTWARYIQFAARYRHAAHD